MEDNDVFWGRCESAHWRPDGTCSHCGGAKPSAALAKIRHGSEVEPTDKSYKLYVRDLNSPGGKCYFNHFSQSQAIEFVLLWVKGKMKIAFPGTFYSGICFSRYKTAIDKAIDEDPEIQAQRAEAKAKLPPPKAE